jgi:hypothetical protein
MQSVAGIIIDRHTGGRRVAQARLGLPLSRTLTLLGRLQLNAGPEAAWQIGSQI